ncbi:Sestrin like protein [Lucilia cuprina]|nr:Sestrin like protein [Lucilia cuprina]
MFRKLTSALYQVTHQQLMTTLTRTKNATLKNTIGELKSSIAQSFFRYEQPLRTSCNKKITIVGSEKTSLPMAKNCLDRELCQQICIMDLQAKKENTKTNLLLSCSPHIKATKHFQDTSNSDLIILTKDIQNRKDTAKTTTIKDTLEQYTNVMKNLIPNLVKYSPNTIFLIDTEQADVVTYVAWKLSRLPKNRVLSPKQIKDFIQEPITYSDQGTADVAAKIIENYHRILLSTLPQVKSNEDNSSKFSQIFSSTFCKTMEPNLNDCRKIIAAARHQCPYLVKMYEKEFINQGGNPEWLNGLDFIPPKLRAIYEINKILAHRPWLLRKEHIENLTRGKNSWSLSEVVHAMVLLSHFHSLSSFVFSCGLTQKLDGLSSPKLKTPPATLTAPQTPTGTAAMQQQQPFMAVENLTQQQQQPQKTVLSEITLNNNNNSMDHHNHQVYCNNNAAVAAAAATVSHSSGGGAVGMPLTGVAAATNSVNGVNKLNAQPSVTVEALMERMKVLSQKQDECSEAELSNRFKNVEMQTAELPAASTVAPAEIPPVISHYIEDPNFTYQDFARRGAENIPNTFRIQDYSWDDHGYSLVNGLYEDVGTLLDQKFRCAYNLTYFTMAGVKNVDTSKFRRAIWNYIQCIYGIRHDDYDYGEVNQLLDRSLKMFIKTACCFPERITTKDYDNILVELQDSEKVHVNLMVMEARNQAELLYALREIMRYRT